MKRETEKPKVEYLFNFRRQTKPVGGDGDRNRDESKRGYTRSGDGAFSNERERSQIKSDIQAAIAVGFLSISLLLGSAAIINGSVERSIKFCEDFMFTASNPELSTEDGILTLGTIGSVGTTTIATLSWRNKRNRAKAFRSF